uniref:C-type lectin domain-containing protein n=1 Tax=Steinernema glaseri TaxID=37863 RepID=A0A1I7Y4B5_9BILA
VWTGGSFKDGVYEWTDGSQWDWENIRVPQNGTNNDYRIQIYWENLNDVESASMRYGYSGFKTSFVCRRPIGNGM